VPDERDLVDVDRPGGDDGLEQVGQRAAVLGDVGSRPWRRPIRRPTSLPIRPWTKTTIRGVASGKAAASASRSGATGSPSTRTEIEPTTPLFTASCANWMGFPAGT